MSLDINVPGGNPNKPGFSVQRSPSGLHINAGALASTNTTRTMFGVANDEGGLSINVYPVPQPAAPGWTVYTYQQSDHFLVGGGWSINSDVLVIGGGGSGGGGEHGGGGGAGGFVDTHDYTISTDAQGDGAVIVGNGGAEVPDSAQRGNNGGISSFATLIAYGGGYGSRQGGSGGYLPSDGASGGGGWGEQEVSLVIPGMNVLYRGYGALAIHGDQGHDGGDCTASAGWYNHSSGGGGGANWPAYGDPTQWAPPYGPSYMNGGLGRPCDIAGRFQWPVDEETRAELKLIGWDYVPWFAGGGAGKERPNNWSYLSGNPGYGGGGGTGQMGEPNTGGGGGGHGWYGSRTPRGEESGHAYGPAGGSGIVVIRILTTDVQKVRYPRPISRDEAGNDVYPDHIHVTHVPADEPHIDMMGDDPPVVIYGWPDPPYDHYGWDGSSWPAV